MHDHRASAPRDRGFDQDFVYDLVLGRLSMNMHSISRSSKRRPLSLLVKSRVQSRVVFVDMIDISEGGCKIRGTRGFAQVGDRVVMKIAGVNAPLGTIAWVNDRYAGVAFEGEMHSAVLDHLCASLGAASPTSVPLNRVRTV